MGNQNVVQEKGETENWETVCPVDLISNYYPAAWIGNNVAINVPLKNAIYHNASAFLCEFLCDY